MICLIFCRTCIYIYIKNNHVEATVWKMSVQRTSKHRFSRYAHVYICLFIYEKYNIYVYIYIHINIVHTSCICVASCSFNRPCLTMFSAVNKNRLQDDPPGLVKIGLLFLGGLDVLHPIFTILGNMFW